MPSSLLQQFVSRLKSCDDKVRYKAARDLSSYINTELSEVPHEKMTKFMDDFNHYIFEMVCSTDMEQRKGGILAIACFIGADFGNSNTQTSKFANYLRSLLPSSDVGVMKLTAKVIGKVAILLGTRTSEYVGFEMKRALERLEPNQSEEKRHGAVLVLKELALTMPTYFYQQVAPFFKLIFSAVKDVNPMIRESAVEALRAALVITAQREMAKQMYEAQWYQQCYKKVISGFGKDIPKERRDVRVDASLLVLNELLRCSNAQWEERYESLMDRLGCSNRENDSEILSLMPRLKSVIGTKWSVKQMQEMDNFYPIYESAVCRNLLLGNLNNLTMYTMNQRMSRNSHILQAWMKLLPRLAAFSKDKFLKNCLSESVKYLLMTLKNREKDRATAFKTIGLIAVAVENYMEPYVPKILEAIKCALPPKEKLNRKRNANSENMALICISLLSQAVGKSMEKEAPELLELMLATGLSPILTTSLRELAHSVPSLKSDISQGLLHMISQVLLNKPYHHPGAPWHNVSTIVPPLHMDVNGSSTVIALRTLGTFNFDQYPLLQFARSYNDHFLTSEETEVRLEAVKTNLRLLRLALKQPLPTVIQTVSEVLSKLLVVSITDSNSDVRFAVLNLLDKAFDIYLAQIESLTTLFIAMNDEMFKVREIAIRIVCRLSSINPRYVMPHLRRILTNYLTELEHSGTGRNKENAAKMIDQLVVGAPRFIRPYTEPILKVLVSKLKESEQNTDVVLALLRAIGDLAEVSGDEMQQLAPELLPILLGMLADANSAEEKGITLWVLGQLVESTGHVMKPYIQYPWLLDLLLNFLKTEQQHAIRMETIRVLGFLGAFDPYKHKVNLGRVDWQQDTLAPMAGVKRVTEESQDFTTSEMLVNMSPSTLDEYYTAIAIATLIKMIKDPALSKHHLMVVQAVTFVFKSLGVKCIPYVTQVMPSFLNVLRSSDISFREYLLQQLAVIIVIVKQHIRNYLVEIFDLIKEFWTVNSPLEGTLIFVAEHIAVAFPSEFKSYIPQMMPQMLRVLNHDTSHNRSVTVKLLSAIQKFGRNLEGYLHLVLPPIIKLFLAADCSVVVNRLALETVERLADDLDLADFASMIILPLVRTLDQRPELRATTMNTLCTLLSQLGQKSQFFVTLVGKIVDKHNITNARYNALAEQSHFDLPMVNGKEYLPTQDRFFKKKTYEFPVSTSEMTPIKLKLFSENLEKGWTANCSLSKVDWLEWLRSFSVCLLKESPSPALRSCYALAQTYSQLPRDLFNAAFVSCWEVLTEPLRVKLIKTLKEALLVPDLPEMTHTILNLAEFMEHCDKGPLPLDRRILGDRAMHCRAYAKALRYKEKEFHDHENGNVFECLISINNKLQQKEAAEALLEQAMSQKNQQDLNVQVRWYEKLHNWDKALYLYQERLASDPDDIKSTLGEMRCLEALGKWGPLHDVAKNQWSSQTEEVRQGMARIAATAAWGLGQWESMERYVDLVPKDTQDGAFYRSILAIHNEQYDAANQFIDRARDLLDKELTAMAGESYQRAYNAMVEAQLLAELEEVIQYKLVPERRATIKSMWWDRLQGGQRMMEDWQKIIQVHTLVLPPHDDMLTWLKYASICRKSGHLKMCHRTLVTLLGTDPSKTPDEPLPTTFPQVTFAYCKHMWVNNKQQAAYDQLERFVSNYSHLSKLQRKNQKDEKQCERQNHLLAKCYLKLGQWLEVLGGVDENSISSVLSYYSSATHHDPSWYKAWHAFASINYETVLFYNRQKGANSEEIHDNQHISRFMVPAVEGFFRSINLSHGNSLQDILRLLTLWFNHGHWPEVEKAIGDGVKVTPVNTWLQVIPQLIARIDIPQEVVSKSIHHLLVDVGRAHPQALVYPLTVAAKSTSQARKTAAVKILNSMSEHSSKLVQQALMTSNELVRVAILWHEICYSTLDKAGQLYVVDRNLKGMFDILDSFHAMLAEKPQTHNEMSFLQCYGRDLELSLDRCNKFKATQKEEYLKEAWHHYWNVFKRIANQMNLIKGLELQYVSPKLLGCKNLELAVPGSYQPGQPIVRIASIRSSLQVIPSKQRPRKLCIRGSDGKNYTFLLKGHEDLRQDERMMQLFGLTNTLLLQDPDTFRKNSAIQRYAVIPLSTNSGLIGWVPHCDTLHTLIKDFREKKGVAINIEHKIMLRMMWEFETLPAMQKVEVFEHAMSMTKGNDLADLMWLKSPSSEVWFSRRTNYTRSLAAMSMVGYILGLGDRHPSNLMLDRLSGKIIHIDFGDCFEVAMAREKYPEKVPFRLTRMLINAMEVTGIEGTYRKTCESVMSVLRGNKDSLIAMLEAFVHDPLLNWRLMNNDGPKVMKAGARVITARCLMKRKDTLKSSTVTYSENGVDNNQPEALNNKALAVLMRVKDKLTGRDFSHKDTLSVQQQVDLLIKEATSNETLCQCYVGWCPFW